MSAPETPQAPTYRGAVAIDTHGCKLNQADSLALARQFLAAGFRVTNRPDEADVFILNTCTVTAAADAKARQALRAAHRRNPGALVVATGCYPQRAAAELRSLPEVGLVAGNTSKAELVSLTIAALRQRGQTSAVPSEAMSTELPPPAPTGGVAILGRTRAMVKLQEGCDQVCAYCIVPRVRGRERSIPPETLLAQINQHLAEGYQEIALTGTQLGTYGFDLSDMSLGGLLTRVLRETAAPRLRVSSLQPQEITPELLDVWQDGRLCPHFHVPLQSGSDRTLKAMRRRYDTARFADSVALIRRALPQAAITADLIVGFPGEDEAAFEESRAFVEAMRFSDLHVFPYSIRPGTSAAHFPNQVAAAAKKERMGAMLAVARQEFAAFRREALGQTRPVLWESAHEEGGVWRWSGLTDNYIRVHATGPGDWRNRIMMARLGELEGESLRATVL